MANAEKTIKNGEKFENFAEFQKVSLIIFKR